jgi:putative transposase
MKAYKFKLKPTKNIVRQFDSTLDLCRELYNASLQERRDSYRTQKKSLNYHDQRAQLPEIKLIRDDLAGLYSQVPQDVLRRVARSYDAFFQRVLANKKLPKEKRKPAGFPRFKSKYRFNSFTYPQSGFRLEGDKLHLSKIGSCRLRLSREIEGKIKTCTIKRQADGWFVIFTVEENQSRWLARTGAALGIDVGLENFATLSDGQVIDNPRFLKQGEREIKITQRKVSKKKLGGSNRRKASRILARKHLKVANQRSDFFHKLSNQLTKDYDRIAIEDLNIRGMLKNRNLAKSISDAAWGTFANILSNKAESAGRKVVRVPAAFTSQDCSGCGERVRKTLATREHRCINPKCGLVLHRDHNAAQNIVALGRAQSVANSGASSTRGPLVRVNSVTQ